MKCAIILLALAFVGASAEALDSRLTFRPGNTNGEFLFDTGVLRGKLRAGGKTMGLSSVTHIPTGARLDGSMGLLSPYRVFTTGKRYGAGVWDRSSTANLRADGSVEVSLPNAPGHPYELRAIYRWHDAKTVEMETTVKADSELPRFEIFLASYFSPQFTNALVFAAAKPKARFVAAEEDGGHFQMYVRDDAAVAMIRDGRWTFPPYPVDWVVRGTLAMPLAIRRAPELKLSAALMARGQECFAIGTPYETESHYSTYFSLFGRDLKPGEIVQATTRLVVRSDLSNESAVALHEQWQQ